MKYISKEIDGTVERITVELNGARYRRVADGNAYMWQRQWGPDWSMLIEHGGLECQYWLMGSPPTLAAKTVKVRIAVAVDSNGEYYGRGLNDGNDSHSLEMARESVGPDSRVYWLTAELPIPTPAVIPAVVETLEPL